MLGNEAKDEVDIGRQGAGRVETIGGGAVPGGSGMQQLGCAGGRSGRRPRWKDASGSEGTVAGKR